MNASSTDGDAAPETNADELALLRNLLFQPEQEQIEHIQERLEDPTLRAEDVSNVLAEAFLIRLGRDDKLARALSPTIESAIEDSTKNNTRALVDAISPLMGPAIRRSILQTISGMIQSMNETLNQSFSIQGFKWRWEAFRTGKSFGEVVMLHTLVFQVEQVFLIHSETGLLLQHITRQAIEAMDADMVSGMLTAIQDFVRDSFGGEQTESLQTMQVGELTVWVEQGPEAVLAAVVRGNPPVDLRNTLQESLESVHLEQKDAFDSFEGDPIYFEGSRRHLENCLQSQYQAEAEKRTKRISPWMWVVLTGVLALFGFWAYVTIQARQQWQGYLERLDAEPGIVIIDSGYQGGKYYVSGMRDPLAIDPRQLVPGNGLAADDVAYGWAPYQSFEPSITLQRANQILRPSAQTRLSVDKDVLYAKGQASQSWIVEAQSLARVLPGITRFDVGELKNADLLAFEQIQREIENTQVLFDVGTDQFSVGQESDLDGLVRKISKLYEQAAVLGWAPKIEVFGFTDPSGAETVNQVLRRLRAEKMVAFLVAQGIPKAHLSSVTGDLSRIGESSGADETRLRRVSFRVVVDHLEGAGQ